MTEFQGGQGATPERMAKGGNFVTVAADTQVGGEVKQVNKWPDIVAFMVDPQIALLDPSEKYGWEAFCNLRSGGGGAGSGGEGWRQQEWLTFGQIIGRAKINWLEELWDYPVPAANKPEEISFTRWRLNRCMDKIRGALSAARGAAQEASKVISGLQGSQ